MIGIVVGISLLGGKTAWAQHPVALTGVVQNETGVPLEAATVVLLRLPDSSLTTYTLSNAQGQYQLRANPGAYLLQASYVGYAPYSNAIALEGDSNWVAIRLQAPSDSLPMVEITAAHLPVQLRGDTLSFNSAAFEVRTHDDVGKLLEQLPGLKVQADGSIWFNGQKVTEVLVDGTTYFGDDAQAVLKNLSADAVQKIDITDTKENSKGQEVEDEKTINLRLKEKAKNNWTLQLMGGYGYTVPPLPLEDRALTLGNHRYRGEVLLNYFTPKFRLTTFVRGDNHNGTSLESGIEALLSESSRPGVSRVTSSGINYNLLGHKKITWNWSYQYQYSRNSVPSERLQTSILPDNQYSQTQQQLLLARNQRHQAQSRWDYRFDQQHRLQVDLRVTYQANSSEQSRAEQTTRASVLRNDLQQQYDQTLSRWLITPRLSFTKKFAKKGRELRFNVNTVWRQAPQIRNNLALTELYNDQGVLTAIDTLSLLQYNSDQQQRYTFSTNYKEPLSDNDALHLNLIGGIEQDFNGQDAFDLENGDTVRNSGLTEAFSRAYNYQNVQLSWHRKTETYRSELTAGLRRSRLEGSNANNSLTVYQELYLPRANASFHYTLEKGKTLILSYFWGFAELQIQQLQPLIDNQDPLAVQVGNTNLVPEQQHRTQLRFDSYDQETFTSMYASASGQATLNSIVQAQYLDDQLRSVFQPVNAGTTYLVDAQVGGNSLAQRWKMKIDGSLEGTWERRPFLLDGQATWQTSWRYGGQLVLSNQKKKIIDAALVVRFQGELAYFPPALEQPAVDYFNHSYGTRFRVTIAKAWEVQTQFAAYAYSSSTFEQTLWVPLWTVQVQRYFFKDEALLVTLSAENLLNEAMQVRRYQYNGVLSEQQSLLLGRYVMLTVQYKLQKR